MKYIITLISSIIITSCGQKRVVEEHMEDIPMEDARMGEQQSLGLNIEQTTVASAETDPTPQGIEDDSADDPAIWVNYKNPEQSIVFGTDKKAGIGAYNLDGKEVGYYEVGRINNIDIRQDLTFKGETHDVLLGTNRTDNSIYFAFIDEDGILIEQKLNGINIPDTEDIYGFSLGYIDGALLIVANDKSGNIYFYSLDEGSRGLDAKLIKQIKLDSQPEGMVVDDIHKVMYVGEEEYGIWKIDLSDFSLTLLANSQEQDNEFLTYDIEGITIYPSSETAGYIIASSQGNNSYLVYDREGDNEYITSFRVVDGTIDGIEETDGVDAVNFNFGTKFPKGFFVAQDGFNFDGEVKNSQNFKLVDWNNIQTLIDENR